MKMTVQIKLAMMAMMMKMAVKMKMTVTMKMTVKMQLTVSEEHTFGRMLSCVASYLPCLHHLHLCSSEPHKDADAQGKSLC